MCVILRHCFKSGCFAPLFLPERLKIETFMLSECTFPPGSVQLWMPKIGCASSRGILFAGYYWLAPVGLCEEKLFWQGPGAQRSCWKLGEGQCRWEQEDGGGWRDGITMAVRAEVLGDDLTATAKGRDPERWPHGWKVAREDEWGTEAGDDLSLCEQHWHSQSTCHDHIRSADSCINSISLSSSLTVAKSMHFIVGVHSTQGSVCCCQIFLIGRWLQHHLPLRDFNN